MCAASLASVETRSERSAESIAALKPPDRWRWLAVNSEHLARAFELTARFRQQLIDLLRDGPADDVYQIEVAIFPVTTKKRENPYAVSGRAVADSGEGS